jgi:hypothetical protein
MLFNPANLVYWIFLGIGVCLFLLVIFSGGGEDQDLDTDMDTDVDIDVDADVDSDVDAEIDAETESELTPLIVLSWLGVGRTPLMLLLAMDFSVWGVIGWMFNVIVGDLTGTIPTGFLAGAIFTVSLGMSLWIGSLLSLPIGKIFATFGEDVSSDRLIGCLGTVTSKKLPYLVEGRIGQVDVLDQARNLVTIEVALPEWATVVPHRGEKVLIIDRQIHGYIAIAEDSSDRDRWLNNYPDKKNLLSD